MTTVTVFDTTKMETNYFVVDGEEVVLDTTTMPSTLYSLVDGTNQDWIIDELGEQVLRTESNVSVTHISYSEALTFDANSISFYGQQVTII